MKRIVALLLSLLFLLPLVSCTKNKPVVPNETAAPNVTAELSETPEGTEAVPDNTPEAGIAATPEPLPADIDFSYSFDPNTDCTATGAYFTGSLAESEEVYYWKKVDSGYLFYAEKDGTDYGALCGKPECIHELGENNCSALIGCSPLSEIYVYDGGIYFMSGSRAADGRYLDTVFHMGLDGTNHKSLLVAGDEDTALQRFYVHRGNAFFTAETAFVSFGEPLVRLEFLCGELEGKEVKTIFEKTVPEDQGYNFAAGFFGKYALFIVSLYDLSDSIAVNELYAYDPESDRLYLVASQEDCDFSIWNVYVTEEGGIYVSPYDSNPELQACVYKVEEGRFVKQFEFEGEDFVGVTTYIIGGYAITLKADWEVEGTDTIWIKDLEGNTVYNGPLTRHFLEGRENATVSRKAMTVCGNTVVFEYDGWLADDPNRSILVGYEITENGLVETTLAEY